MKNKSSNPAKKFLFAVFASIAILLFTFPVSHADKDSAIETYKNDLQSMGFSGNAADEAKTQVESFIDTMKASQEALDTKYQQLEKGVNSMNSKDSRKGDAEKLLKKAEDAKSAFKSLDPADHVTVETTTGGTAPQIMPDEAFIQAETDAADAINAANRAMIAPEKPENVPQGDIMGDFIPQLIRQLFRFAWLAVLVSMIVSGVYFIISFDNDERLGKAKRMIYYTLLGFAFVAMAFAMVKAITDIDFFNFI